LLVLRHVRAAGRLEPDRGGTAGPEAARARSLDPVPRGGGGGRGRGTAARDGCSGRCEGPLLVPRRSVDLVSAPVAPAFLAVGRSTRPGRRIRHTPRASRGVYQ